MNPQHPNTCPSLEETTTLVEPQHPFTFDPTIELKPSLDFLFSSEFRSAMANHIPDNPNEPDQIFLLADNLKVLLNSELNPPQGFIKIVEEFMDINRKNPPGPDKVNFFTITLQKPYQEGMVQNPHTHHDFFGGQTATLALSESQEAGPVLFSACAEKQPEEQQTTYYDCKKKFQLATNKIEYFDSSKTPHMSPLAVPESRVLFTLGPFNKETAESIINRKEH